MTGATLLEFLEELIGGDSVGEDIGYHLLTMANDELEGERDWEALKAYDASQSASPSDTYLTAKTLPSNFLYERELYVGDDRIPYQRVPFEQRESFRGIARRYYIDMLNSQFFLTGTVSTAGSIKLFYQKGTGEISSGTTPLLPSRFHRLIGIRAAEMHFAADNGEISRSWDAKWRQVGRDLKRGMIFWDTQLKLRAMQGARQGIHIDSLPDVVA